MHDISAIQALLLCETPDRWIETALQNQEILLVDHANCEKKAASTALNMIYRYVDKYDLLTKMSRLAREELRHFEQVIAIMKKRNIEYVQLSSARYAGGMREGIRTHEPEKLIDSLIIGAFIEARSCERFAKLAPFLDDELQAFYLSLLKSESRHFEDYLKLAEKYAAQPIDDRIIYYANLERSLIESPDDEFRFHSGPVS
ncbi:tRNA-(ms[2]io[6]A)-hydroxylase [marine gamma proteobacterium HTCC2143]|jgi:tRNA-(ms[2]io[6]A)-hydroxylase|uniref:tRNA-(Ms[2]io[6]A)-hydroxylase n=1 Tax=marine gamma proteobacterium HTCC2143 TaxID=247633 RepID=A0YGT1_9GAMM|nr:tRNA-(ms[2]io[6]A)-hydroxylase [marine gamma proteobacterium HTCC2143]